MSGDKKPRMKLLTHKMEINLQMLSPFMENRIMGDLESSLIITP